MMSSLESVLASVGTLVREPLTFGCVSFLVSLAALLLAAMSGREQEPAHREARRFRENSLDRLKKIDGRLFEHEAAIRRREAKLARETPEPVAPEPILEPVEAAAPETGVEVVAEPALPSDPLEGKRAHLSAFLTELLSALDTWAHLAGFDLDAVVDLRGQVNQLLRMVAFPAEDRTLQAVAHELLPPLITDTLKVMLSKTDRDMDPERANSALQRYILEFMRPEISWKLSLIDPAEGDRMDPREHNSVGAVAGGAGQPGSVARTRVRGLRWSGQVVVKAEVLEYD